MLCHDVMDGNDEVPPESCSWHAFDPVKFIMRRKTVLPSVVVVGFETPKSPFKIGIPRTVNTVSNGIQTQTLRLTSSNAIFILSPSLTWTLPGIRGSSMSSLFLINLSGLHKNSFVRGPTQLRQSIQPPCSSGGSAGSTWSNVNCWQTETSSPLYPTFLLLMSFCHASSLGLICGTSLEHLRRAADRSELAAACSDFVQRPLRGRALNPASRFKAHPER